GFGQEIIDLLAGQTGVFIDFYDKFDRILLAEESIWFNGKTREKIYQKVAGQTLNIETLTWGENRTFNMTHILFDGKLPKFLGFDKGPIVGIGSRATVHQGQIYRSAGRDTTFFPSFRIVTDMSSNDIFSNLAGGPSDRRFSKWYCSDLNNWINGKYKKTAMHSDQKKLPF
ncbi:MAG: penicillin acylase family protein, partial [Desulfosarcina sp.]|nr:penicillin acylase family protein [Desulfobacterales bacterium]